MWLSLKKGKKLTKEKNNKKIKIKRANKQQQNKQN